MWPPPSGGGRCALGHTLFVVTSHEVKPMNKNLEKMAREIEKVAREIMGYGLYFDVDYREFLQDLHKQVGLTDKSVRQLKGRDFVDKTYETLAGDKIKADTKDQVKMEYGQGEYDEWRI